MAERRLHPRFRVAWAARLGREDTGWHDAEVGEISIVGFAVSLSREAVEDLAQSGRLLMPGDTVEVRFVAGDRIPPTSLAYAAAVRQVRRIARDRYVVGAIFDDMSPALERAMQEAITQVSEPAPYRPT